MKTKNLVLFGAALLAAGAMITSCGGKKADTATEEAVDESFVPDEKITATDSLQQVEEMVEAVETPVKGINGTSYNAAFFNNESNKADKASTDKYAVTSTGLKYVIAKEGNGKSPKATDTVLVHYVGQLTDGTEFDSSISRGEPISFPLNGVIPGWTEGLQLMKEGGEAVFYIPSNLAYGERGIQNPYTGEYSIPPSAPLVFWVQLIQVQ